MREWLHEWKIRRIRNRRSRMERAKAQLSAEVERDGAATRVLRPLGMFWQDAIGELCEQRGYHAETIAVTTPRGGVVLCKVSKGSSTPK